MSKSGNKGKKGIGCGTIIVIILVLFIFGGLESCNEKLFGADEETTTLEQTTSVITTATITTATTTTTTTTTATTTSTTYAVEEQEESLKQTYVLNTDSGVFHRSNCRHVKRMNNANKSTITAAYDEMIARGYKPCGTCLD